MQPSVRFFPCRLLWMTKETINDHIVVSSTNSRLQYSTFCKVVLPLNCTSSLEDHVVKIRISQIHNPKGVPSLYKLKRAILAKTIQVTNPPYQLGYKDEDGDLVLLTSDRDLLDALDGPLGNNVKIQVKEILAGNKSAKEQELLLNHLETEQEENILAKEQELLLNHHETEQEENILAKEQELLLNHLEAEQEENILAKEQELLLNHLETKQEEEQPMKVHQIEAEYKNEAVQLNDLQEIVGDPSTQTEVVEHGSEAHPNGIEHHHHQNEQDEQALERSDILQQETTVSTTVSTFDKLFQPKTYLFGMKPEKEA